MIGTDLGIRLMNFIQTRLVFRLAFTGVSWILFTCTLIAQVSAAPTAQTTSNLTDMQQRLTRGDVVIRSQSITENTSAIIQAAINIAAPPATVWAVMTDCQRSPKYIKGLKSCRILKSAKDGEWDVREHRVKAAWFLPETRTVFRSAYDKPREIVFTRVAGDLKKLEGKWNLVPIKNGRATQIRYAVEVSVDVPIASYLIRKALETNMTDALLSLRQEVASNAR